MTVLRYWRARAATLFAKSHFFVLSEKYLHYFLLLCDSLVDSFADDFPNDQLHVHRVTLEITDHLSALLLLGRIACVNKKIKKIKKIVQISV